ncbi:hypothetical protein ACHAWF_017922 [Thalassiosira exigua]
MIATLSAVISLFLAPKHSSHALAPSSSNFGFSPGVHRPQSRHERPESSRGRLPSPSTAIPRSVRRRRRSLLGAVVENAISTEPSEAADRVDATDVPAPLQSTPPAVTVIAGPEARITSVSGGVVVEQDLWGDLADKFLVPDEEGQVEEHAPHQPNVLRTITNENSEEVDSSQDTSFDETDDAASGSVEDSSEEGGRDGAEAGESAISSTIAKSALLHRAGIAGAGRKSTRSNGRSSRAKSHVTKSRRGASRNAGSVGGIRKVLGTVRTAAAAAASEKMKSAEEGGGSGENFTTKNSLETSPSSLNGLKSSVQSIVADILETQDFAIQQQSVGALNSLPPGTTSMGILGEVVHDELPPIPPLPGSYLVCASGDTPGNRAGVGVRASVPHSTDDTHIANLRLSVFSRFNEEQQRIFRSRSLEVLNTRRRRGAVALVAEAPNKGGGRNRFLNEVQARIIRGHTYGAPAAVAHASPGIRSIRSAKLTSSSSGATANHCPTVATTGLCDGNKENVCAGGVAALETDRGRVILGSVECSHQEFRGTMLGNSRPKGSLMYVTEVAVKTDARRCGAGAMLMKGVDEVAALRDVETIYLHVDVSNRAACALYEKCGYRYLDKREPVYAQFTASLNLHDGAMHGRKHHIMCKNAKEKMTWL